MNMEDFFWVGQRCWSCTEAPQVEVEGEKTATKKVFFSDRVISSCTKLP